MTAKLTQTKTKEKTKKTAKRTSNFELVASGKCPHCEASLGDEVAGRGIGTTRVCSKCEHRWYLNRLIITCKCVTCCAIKRKRRNT